MNIQRGNAKCMIANAHLLLEILEPEGPAAEFTGDTGTEGKSSAKVDAG